MELIKDKTKFEAACASVAKRGAKLDAEIQVLALSAADHALVHKNPHFINKLYTSLSAGVRKSAMTEWLLKYAGVSANAGANKKELPFLMDREKSVNMAGGAEEPWFLCKPDAAPDEVFDIIAALAAVIKKAQGKSHDPLLLAKLENFKADLAQAPTAAVN